MELTTGSAGSWALAGALDAAAYLSQAYAHGCSREASQLYAQFMETDSHAFFGIAAWRMKIAVTLGLGVR